MSVPLTAQFLRECKRFAVVGASADRSKFGNKVLRAYADAGLEVVPVHPKLDEIEGLAVKQLEDLENPAEWGISIVTPPAISAKVLEKAHGLGFRWFWFQPGAENAEVKELAAGMEDSHVLAGGPCVLVSIRRGEHRAAGL
mmetsp:Transcript_6891/g.17630  ORF Transcript_6891/g.17630 Transcript_6891/m.17630 type:complete len:141 (-) Transcript_6891:1691-2113(-)